MANEATKLTIGGVQHDIMDAEARRLIALLQAALDAMTGTDTTTAIETFQEVLDFLAGVTDDETLVGKITALQTAINGKVDKENGKGLSTEDYTTAEKTKLAGLENYDDSALQTAVAGKVDKESGKSLMTDAEHTKLAGIDPSTYATKTEVNAKQDTINDLDAIRSGASAGATAYQKPANGIPASDIASGVIPDTSGFATTSAMNTALASKANASDVYTKTQTDTLLSGKQNTLTFDSTPTASSTNPVTSGGVKTYVDGKASITGITTNQDGTFTIALSDGNSYTVNLNHVHPQYLKYELLENEAAYNALATKDSSTLYLIPES